jgi:hypothetical protein
VARPQAAASRFVSMLDVWNTTEFLNIETSVETILDAADTECPRHVTSIGC